MKVKVHWIIDGVADIEAETPEEEGPGSGPGTSWVINNRHLVPYPAED